MLCLLFSCFSTRSTFSTLLWYVCYFRAAQLILLFHAAPLCQLFTWCSTLTTFFHAAALCLPFPCFFTMSTFTILIQCTLCLLSPAAALCLFSNAVAICLRFQAALLCLLFPRCFSMSSFSKLFHYAYFFKRCPFMSTLSKLLWYVYMFHAAPLCLLFHVAPLCLLFPRFCGMFTFSTLRYYVYFFFLAIKVKSETFTVKERSSCCVQLQKI